MKILKEKEKVEAFWQKVAKGRVRRLLMLDYDGTLSPFVAERLKAYPYPGLPGILERILDSSKNRVVIISGRNALEVKELLGLNVPVEIWGGHGMERLLPSGRLVQVPVSRESEEVFHQVEEWADHEGLSRSLEEKHGSMAFHVRGMGKSRADRLLEEATEFFKEVSSGSDLKVNAFDGGVELRTRGVDKGRVVRELLEDFDKNCACSYYGDDLTDEDAFSALDGSGVSFLVRKKIRQTNADVWIIPPDELKECLARYIL